MMDHLDCTVLSAFLKTVPDPRNKHGQRYTWDYVLTLLCMGLASGLKTPYAIYRWGKWNEEELVRQLAPARESTPGKMVFYRALNKMDIGALETSAAKYGETMDEWLREQAHEESSKRQGWRAVSADGKELRGASKHGPKVLLVSLVCHKSGITVGQTRAKGKPYEPHALAELLRGQDLKGTVITADALYTHEDLAQQILDQGGDYFLVVKGNQPRLQEDIAFCFDQNPLPGEERWETVRHHKGHGRIETRRVISTEVLNDYLRMPGVGQVVQRECSRTLMKTRETQKAITYAITSLTHARASVEQLADLWRGQWTIENRSHYVRDETMGEDRGQFAQGDAPQAMAALRNAVLAALRARGWDSIADAIRYHAASITHSVALVTKSLSERSLQLLPTFPR